MAQLTHSAVADLRRAVEGGRSAIVVGPARSGLTWHVNQQATIGFDPIVKFSVRGVNSVDRLKSEMRGALGLPALPERPSDVQLALAERQVQRRAQLVVVNDCHRAAPDALAWLLQAALEPVAGVPRAAVPFVFEGAFDPDQSLAGAFPAMSPDPPLVLYVESAIAWRTLTEVEEVVRSRWRPSYTSALIPWLADVTGGDALFLHEILERLPHDGTIVDETLAAALQHVSSSGQRSKEIRESVPYVGDEGLLRTAVTGRGIPGVMPSALGAGPVRRAYFSGVLVFDGIGSVYRVRSPMTAQVLAKALGVAPEVVFESRYILGRLLIFFAHIAAFELDLRALLRTRGPKEIAAGVSVDTGLSALQNTIKGVVVRTCAPTPPEIAGLSEALKAELPGTRPLLEALRLRMGADPTEDGLLEALSFAELGHLAEQAELFAAQEKGTIREINERRNALAHFRAEPYERCQELLAAISRARRVLDRLP